MAFISRRIALSLEANRKVMNGAERHLAEGKFVSLRNGQTGPVAV